MIASKNSPSTSEISVISCIDMDAYYAQAESRRLGFSDSVPLGVKQWNGLIAVNYEARKFKISRFTTAEEAKSLCPNIRLPHVDTYKIDEGGKIVLSSIDDKFTSHNRAKEKVSLDYYRKESKKIFSIIKKNFSRVEVASIDEVFIDLTEEVNKIYTAKTYENKWYGIVLGEKNDENIKYDESEIKIMIGSYLIQKTCQEIDDIYQYKCSAGISYNKLLAKLASGLNKPNQQTIVLSRYMPDCIGYCNIGKLRNFGGKISQAFESKSVLKVSDALKLTKEDLNLLFDTENEVNYVYNRMRGYDDEDVKTAESLLKGLKTKHMLSQKTMGRKPAVSMSDLEVCVDLIILDLSVRMNHFYEETNTLPQSLTMNYYDNVDLAHKTKSCELRMFGNEQDLKTAIEKNVKELLFSINHVIFPCFSISFALRNFKSEKGMYLYNLSDYCKKIELDEKKKLEEEKNNPENDCKETKLCDKCGIFIYKDQFETHLDYHLACDIDKSLNPNKKKYKSDSKIKEESKKVEQNTKKIQSNQKNNDKNIKNNRKIEDFFKKQ